MDKGFFSSHTTGEEHPVSVMKSKFSLDKDYGWRRQWSKNALHGRKTNASIFCNSKEWLRKKNKGKAFRDDRLLSSFAPHFTWP